MSIIRENPYLYYYSNPTTSNWDYDNAYLDALDSISVMPEGTNPLLEQAKQFLIEKLEIKKQEKGEENGK